MAPQEPQPWQPEHRWADPFIVLLCLVSFALCGLHWRALRAMGSPPEIRVTLEGQALDAALGGAQALGKSPFKGLPVPRIPLTAVAARTRNGWDRAVLAVHQAEAGELEEAGRLAKAAPGPVGDRFRQAFARAYQGAAAAPTAADLEQVRSALGDGCAARLLEARLAVRSGGRAETLAESARAWALSRLMLLAAAGLGALLLATAGLAFGLVQALNPAPRAPLPRHSLSGRALLIVLLGWFLTFLSAGTLVALLLRGLPGFRPYLLPLTYALHAGLGTTYLCRAEGITLRQLVRRVAPAPRAKALAMGLGYYTLAFTSVLAVAWVLSPFLGREASPQQQLFNLLSGLKGILPLLLLFATVACLAPAFEELLFRGFLLPWLAERLAPRFPQRARLLAALITALAFGAIHLQPLGLPVLTTLGLVLGFAFLRTGNLSTSILVHALWNAGVFLLVRSF